MDESSSHYRYRITFGKGGPLQYTGHLDLQRAWERLLRRANVPLGYSEGFHRRPKFQFAATLPLGYTSDCERLDIWTTTPYETTGLLEWLKQVATPGIEILEVDAILDPHAKALSRSIEYAEYRAMERISSSNRISVEEMTARVARLMAQPHLMRERRGKTYDLRPLIHDLACELTKKDVLCSLRMMLSHRDSAVGRADEVLLALELDAGAWHIHRCRLIWTSALT